MDVFDNTKPNVILLTDFPSNYCLPKVHGPHVVAHALRCAGFEVAVINHLHIFTYEELVKLISGIISDKTLFLGVNNVFYNKLNGDDLVETWESPKLGSFLPHGKHYNRDFKDLLKTYSPAIKLVAGGPTALDIALNSDFDYVVVGYADCSIVNLANHLLNGETLAKSFKSIHGNIIVDDAVAEKFDFTHKSMEYKSYDCILPGDTLLIEVGRGCIFQCAFCTYPLNGKKKLDYIRDPESLRNEFIHNYEKWNVTKYRICDDTFNDSYEKVKMFHDVVMTLPFKIQYWAYLRLDLLVAHPETLPLLMDSGLRATLFGIESLNKQSGSSIGKGMAREKQVAMAKHIKDVYGDKLFMQGSFIAGLPFETKETLQETFDSLLSGELPLDSWTVNPLKLYNNVDTPARFQSLIAKDPAKYGYKNMHQIPGTIEVYWETDTMTLNEADAMCAEFKIKASKKTAKLIGIDAFAISSMGFDLDSLFASYFKDIKFDVIYYRKNKVAKMVKKKMFEAFGVLPK